MKQNETKKSQKIPKYFCKNCEYITDNKKDFTKHSLTPKHQNLLNETNLKQKIPKNPQKSQTFKCYCEKIYNSRTSLWRHKQICKSEIIHNNDTNNKIPDTELIMILVKQNSELLEVIKNGTSNNSFNTNSNNKTFNLNLFLNETCKDAMNIMDFIDSIKLQLSDLEKVGKIGYVNGISDIIVKHLNALEVEKRPVHCTDKKREILYVKDENKWEKEDEEKNNLRKAIKRVASKNQRLLPEFKQIHPDCIKSSSIFSDQYNKMIVESMGGSGDNDSEKEDKIIKNITKEVSIDKNLY
jgi:hypothetical protein